MFSWFRKKSSEENFEQILASLEISIQKRQTQLSEIRLRERRTTLLVTLWAFSIWAGYVALWWAGFLGRRGGRSVLWGLPVLVGPVIVIFTRRMVQSWYARKENAEEKTLKELIITQRKKIDEIKKKTNYYSTKSLLERYGDENNSTPNTKRRILNQSPQPMAQPQPKVVTHDVLTGQMPGSQRTNQFVPYSPDVGQLPTPKKQWYDKVADAILGDDTASTGPPAASRYALICEKCFVHNGLVKEEQWADTQYVCPKCGHFNKSTRARKALNSPITPKSTSNIPFSSSAFPSAKTSTSSPSSPIVQPVEAPSDPLVEGADKATAVPASPPSAKPSAAAKSKVEKSPLSESTVLVERADVEEMDVDL